MYTERMHQKGGWTVSIQQPHVRSIVRGKAKACVEFGVKVAVSMVNGYAFHGPFVREQFFHAAVLPPLRSRNPLMNRSASPN